MSTDAADDYLLRHLEEAGVDLGGTVVVLGDRTGELLAALPMKDGRPVLITDSYLAMEAARARVGDAATLLSTQDEPPARIDVLLIRVPKILALLEDQLHRLAPRLHEGSVVVGTGKATEIHTSTLNLLTQLVGPTRTSLAVRKARLIFTEPDVARIHADSANPWPLTYPLPADRKLGPIAGHEVTNHAGVFCADRLDIGTRFFLQYLPVTHGGDHIVDLGCGNGVVGTAAALANPTAQLTFLDESYQAVASARATYEANIADPGNARFVVGDAMSPVEDASADLVLNNPPFHTHRATTDLVAWRMFTGARRALRPGGQLWVVGNRHLGYHVKLRKIFGNCETVAGSPKFVILRSVR
ncbi:methyltransferase [Actinospica acidithermotolerans]|uniref:methyltransferase n=1 Tax=Actinospica acidithermotolerans TaxID=2828514 RepID=UPI0027DC3265|nr:methyltransferase [Actinospica acidithermotolerans]